MSDCHLTDLVALINQSAFSRESCQKVSHSCTAVHEREHQNPTQTLVEPLWNVDLYTTSITLLTDIWNNSSLFWHFMWPFITPLGKQIHNLSVYNLNNPAMHSDLVVKADMLTPTTFRGRFNHATDKLNLSIWEPWKLLIKWTGEKASTRAYHPFSQNILPNIGLLTKDDISILSTPARLWVHIGTKIFKGGGTNT